MTNSNIVQKVTQGGYCIGCGVCALQSDSVHMELNKYGQMIPVVDATKSISEADNTKIAQTCGFSGEGDNEDVIGKKLYGQLKKDHEIGHYRSIFAGRVKEDKYFLKGSSGGIGKWILEKLLKDNHVDFVIQVVEADKNTSNHSAHYEYRVFSSFNEILNGSKSAYYPIELSSVLKFVRETPGRYAITGVPCFVKTIRRLQQVDAIYADRILFTIGIICGHLKTKSYAEMIGWQLGVEPDQLAALDFRKKIKGAHANQKGVQAKDLSGNLSREDIVQNVFGTNYGHGMFKYAACDYCDDVVSETADVSVGDAWLPEFLDEGTSLTIVRNQVIQSIVDEYKNELRVSELNSRQAADSQRSGLRHRRDYLQYRLWLKEKSKHWFPKKRVEPDAAHITKRARKIVETRMIIAEKSHSAFFQAKAQRNFHILKNALLPYVNLLVDLDKSPTVYVIHRLLRHLGLYDFMVSFKRKARSLIS